MSTVLERLKTALADRYRLERELGAGGMATGYLGHDLKHDRDVAIKLLHPDLGAALGGERFLSEIRTPAEDLKHDRKVAIKVLKPELFYVMPYIRAIRFARSRRPQSRRAARREKGRYTRLMTPPTSIQQQLWMAQWRSAAVELARVGQAELRSVDLWRVAADLEDACVESARADQLAPASSGLIEQQRLMHQRTRA